MIWVMWVINTNNINCINNVFNMIKHHIQIILTPNKSPEGKKRWPNPLKVPLRKWRKRPARRCHRWRPHVVPQDAKQVNNRLCRIIKAIHAIGTNFFTFFNYNYSYIMLLFSYRDQPRYQFSKKSLISFPRYCLSHLPTTKALTK